MTEDTNIHLRRNQEVGDTREETSTTTRRRNTRIIRSNQRRATEREGRRIKKSESSRNVEWKLTSVPPRESVMMYQTYYV